MQECQEGRNPRRMARQFLLKDSFLLINYNNILSLLKAKWRA
jgi:hypothetical protein